MPHGITLTSNFVSALGLPLSADTPIGIIGTATSGTNNQIYRVRTASDISQFGAIGTNTIVPAINILQKYGCNNLFVIKVATGADAAATATNIIGTDPGNGVKTGLPLFKDCYSQFLVRPQIILVPNFSTDAIVTKALEIADSPTVQAIVAFDFPIGTTTAQVTTTRGTSTGLGTKSSRLIPCAPWLKNGANFESPATHFAGLVAATTFANGAGYSPSNKQYVGITGTESGFTLSYTDQNADNIKLENLGVFSTAFNTAGYVGWGNNNALFVDDVVETGDTYIPLTRIKQLLDLEFLELIKNYIDLPCNYSTAKALERALWNIVDNHIDDMVLINSRVNLNMANSNFAARLLYYDIIIINVQATLNITANIQYSVQF